MLYRHMRLRFDARKLEVRLLTISAASATEQRERLRGTEHWYQSAPTWATVKKWISLTECGFHSHIPTDSWRFLLLLLLLLLLLYYFQRAIYSVTRESARRPRTLRGCCACHKTYHSDNAR